MKAIITTLTVAILASYMLSLPYIKPYPKNSPQKGVTVSVWHWNSQSESFGINKVILDSSKASYVIASYIRNKITRVYGGYFNMPGDDATKKYVKEWNYRLSSKNIKSIYLIGSPKWIYKNYRKDMIALIYKNYVMFNKTSKPQERLFALHLDIEPHALAEWKTASKERKRELLEMLKDAYTDARKTLISNNMGKDEIMADIPFWYDSLNAIGWKSANDRQSWFNEVAATINGLSIMNYESSTIKQLLNRTEWIRNNFKGIVELGFNADDIGTAWTDKYDFKKGVTQIYEKTKNPIAIHRYISVLKLQENNQ